jgi:hypothetical protein
LVSRKQGDRQLEEQAEGAEVGRHVVDVTPVGEEVLDAPEEVQHERERVGQDDGVGEGDAGGEGEAHAEDEGGRPSAAPGW